MPVIFVSWYDALRFANWLHNGQGSGDTETGAYTLDGGTLTPSNGLSITRNAGALWFLTSEDEWYKAAYHQNDGVTANYFDYPTGSDTAPIAEPPAGGSNSANYEQVFDVLTVGGAYTASDSSYGTFDQGGNVWEWNESLILDRRGFEGGLTGRCVLQQRERRAVLVPVQRVPVKRVAVYRVPCGNGRRRSRALNPRACRVRARGARYSVPTQAGVSCVL